jgi:cytosol alanyl aminopeptidase
VADRGDDRALVSEAGALAARWLDDPRGLAPDVVGPFLAVAAQHGDRKLFDRIHAEARKEKDQTRRAHLIGAMRSFRDPGIVKDALAIVLTDELDLRDALPLLAQDDRMADVAFTFYKQSYDALMAKLPDDVRSETIHVASPLCDEARRADVESFFKGRADKLTGGPRTLAQVLERISLCIAQRNAQQESLSAFLKKR